MREEDHLVNLLIEVADKQAEERLRTSAARLHRQKTREGRKLLLDTVSLSQWHGLVTEAAGSQTVGGILAYLVNSDKAPRWTVEKGKEIKDVLVQEIAGLHKQAESEASAILDDVRTVVRQGTNLPSLEEVIENLLWSWTLHYLSLVTRLKRGGE